MKVLVVYGTDEKELDLEKLEDVKVTFGKDAFAPKVMYCDECNIRMKKVSVEMSISLDIKVRLDAFKCPKCKEESVGLDEAKKLGKALVMSRLLSNKYSFSFKRKLSFDGDNYIFRLPSELTKGERLKEVKVVPLESKEALIKW